MTGREVLERLKKEHTWCEGGGNCGHGWSRATDGHCRCSAAFGECQQRRLIAALEEALALEHKHCGLEFCEAEDEVLAKLSGGS